MRVQRIIVNGRILTFDPACPETEALAISEGKIVALGDTREIRHLARADTIVHDAAGGMVLPGFIDSHVHLFGGAKELDDLNLINIESEVEAKVVIDSYSEARPDEPLLFACAASYCLIAPEHSTTRHDLDRLVPNRPFACMSSDHHTVWANTLALQAAGILHGADLPPGNEIVMASDGMASGELREPAAYAPILALSQSGGRELLGVTTGNNPVPPATATEQSADANLIARGLKHCAEQGITSLHNMDGNFYQCELLDRLQQDGRLLCRTEIPFHLKNFDPIERLDEAAEMRTRYNSPWLWSKRVKMFMDGVIESATALMLRPYPGSEHCGDAVFSADQFNQACCVADAMDLQISTHAIGDLAVRRTIDGYQKAQQANGKRDSRHRIEHVETIHPDDIPRLAELGIVASMQPIHSPAGGFFPSDGLDENLHLEQFAAAFPMRTLRNHGIKVIFSTDWPVVPINVMSNIKAAIAPVTMPAPWRNQTQSLMDTLASYTCDSAWVEFNENWKGRLMPEMAADIVVLSHDLRSLVPSDVEQVHAVLTICGGRVTHPL